MLKLFAVFLRRWWLGDLHSPVSDQPPAPRQDGFGVTFHLARAMLNAHRREPAQREPHAPHPTVLIESEVRRREGPKKTPNPDPTLSRAEILWRQAARKKERSRARSKRRFLHRHR